MRWWPPLLHLALIGAVAALAVLRFGALETAATDPGNPSGAAAEQPTTPAGGVPEPGLAAAEVDLADLTARPLFAEGRRSEAPSAQNESPTPVTEVESPVFRMVGYLNDGNLPRAILSLDPDAPDVIVREGEEIQDVTVLRIGRDTVVLRQDGKEITINMFGQ
jgi:hypothetical protein